MLWLSKRPLSDRSTTVAKPFNGHLVAVAPVASTGTARMDASLRAHGVVVTRRTIQRRNIITSDAALPNHTALVPLGQHPTAALRDGDENAKTG